MSSVHFYIMLLVGNCDRSISLCHLCSFVVAPDYEDVKRHLHLHTAGVPCKAHLVRAGTPLFDSCWKPSMFLEFAVLASNAAHWDITAPRSGYQSCGFKSFEPMKSHLWRSLLVAFKEKTYTRPLLRKFRCCVKCQNLQCLQSFENTRAIHVSTVFLWKSAIFQRTVPTVLSQLYCAFQMFLNINARKLQLFPLLQKKKTVEARCY